MSTNPLTVKCPKNTCKCVVLPADKATLVHCTPRVRLPELGTETPVVTTVPDEVQRMLAAPSTEGGYFWMVTDVMDFDNIGVSHTKDGIKYLACADCDLAPIGYCDTKTDDSKHKYLIAVDRVAYKPKA
ncbi:hypothetical protein GGI20_002789 [Coemansia sp. BCRC 34301]|nr:hypothetical protein GGI20_002789 [Coemansia sp. BCRC 34301]